ncbi:Conserved hypothetical protein [Candidatus Phytoplasma australiense]|uniref:Lipoprotein n=1 Tax=Phytoplasma australiense TaxID=59748 RepID=B1V9W8_PHYAS|nr:Conserved hypothetical protein [Candidatus Phytoplasma australiense]
MKIKKILSFCLKTLSFSILACYFHSHTSSFFSYLFWLFFVSHFVDKIIDYIFSYEFILLILRMTTISL